MNVALVIAQALAAAGLGTVGTNIQIGRKDPDVVPDNGLWSVVKAPGTSTGGNLATWKERVPVQVQLLLKSEQAQRMYDVETQVKAAVMQIPTVNANIPSITCSSVGDFEADVAGARVGVWNVEAITITDGRYI